MNEKKIIIRQDPVAQPRPRITRFMSYDPAKDKKNWARIQLAEQIEEKIDKPIEMSVIFYMSIPKSTSIVKRYMMIANKIKHQKKKDLDNLLKYILDVKNGIAFNDDKQIWKVEAQKIYSDDPRTEILLKWD